MRTFVYTDATSNKFWHVTLSGNSFTVHFGRVGTTGQTQTKTFGSAAAAQKEHDKLVAQKLKKGYVETTAAKAEPAPAPAVSNERAALEAALVAHPDEVAAHSAYADLLIEDGDPRGEFVRTQLALEDATRPKADRDALKKREKELLKAHAKQWLGDVGRFLVGPWSGEDKPYHCRFARGWLDSVRTLPIPEPLVAALARSPEARLLRRLDVVYDMKYHPHSFYEFTQGASAQLREGEEVGETYDAFPTLPFLAESPYLTNLRVLKYGFSDDHDGGPSHSTMVRPFEDCTADALLAVLKNCPRLEELYLNTDFSPIDDVFGSKLLGNLRVFQYYYGMGEYEGPNPYPLSGLARNKALAKLTTLRFHPGRDAEIDLDEFYVLLRSKNLAALQHLQVHMTTFGDEGAERVVASGILERLKTLDMAYGNMTDEGARVLAASRDLKNLELLDVSRNALTRTGINALKKAGVRAVVADEQHNDDPDDTAYLYSVDWE